LAAMEFVNSPVGRQLHLRGVNAKVVQPGSSGSAMSRELSSEEGRWRQASQDRAAGSIRSRRGWCRCRGSIAGRAAVPTPAGVRESWRWQVHSWART
jgi:hypothetical protein